MQLFDNLLNRITMYRLVVYVLGALAGLGIILALLGWLAMSPTKMVLTLALLLGTAYVADRGFGRLFHVPPNTESWLITGLILFLIEQPATSLPSFIALGLAGALSGASKFLISRHGKHIFNPAAFAAAFLSLWGIWPATWWIGSTIFWPVMLILGTAVVRKIRRWPLVLTFIGVSLPLQAMQLARAHLPVLSNLVQAVAAAPLLFLATIMLTEPATMPPRRNLQVIYAALVAVLYVTGWHLGPLIIYPEVALLIGNVFAYAVSPKVRLRLQLVEMQKLSNRVYNYVFRPDQHFAFLPGQYMEWTLDNVPYDSRGNRRTVTIASSPTETDVQLGIKFYEPASAFKTVLQSMRPGDTIYASHLSGDFTLPGNRQEKLAFIAGGIGITPFRSMVSYLRDTNQPCDIIIMYIAGDPQELVYLPELQAAAGNGVHTIPVVTRADRPVEGATAARLNAQLIRQAVPDYADRLFYISGPNTMVEATKSHLRHLGVQRRRIKTDYFSGY